MINLICQGVERIVFSGINGKALIPLLIILLWVAVGQVEEFIETTKQIFKEEEKTPIADQAK